jgi:dynein heavy chain
MLDALLVEEVTEPDELEAFFLQALYWSIGGSLLEDGRIKFDAQIKTLAALSTASDDEKNFAKAGED